MLVILQFLYSSVLFFGDFMIYSEAFRWIVSEFNFKYVQISILSYVAEPKYTHNFRCVKYHLRCIHKYIYIFILFTQFYIYNLIILMYYN